MAWYCSFHLSAFPCFKKLEFNLWNHFPVCMSVYPPINFWMPYPNLYEIGIFIMICNFISIVQFINSRRLLVSSSCWPLWLKSYLKCSCTRSGPNGWRHQMIIWHQHVRNWWGSVKYEIVVKSVKNCSVSNNDSVRRNLKFGQ